MEMRGARARASSRILVKSALVTSATQRLPSQCSRRETLTSDTTAVLTLALYVAECPLDRTTRTVMLPLS